MPFALSVRSPAAVPGYPYTDAINSQADFDREQTRFRGLQSELQQRYHCCIETSGHTPNFTVIALRDRHLDDIKTLILGAGALLDEADIWELDCPEDMTPALNDLDLPPHMRRQSTFSSHSRWRVKERLKPVDTAEHIVDNVTGTEVPFETDHGARVEAFLSELRDILMLRQLNPDDLDQLLQEAHAIVDHEDPERGPHAGLILSIETALKARQNMQQDHMSFTTVSA